MPKVNGADPIARRGPGIAPLLFEAQRSATNVGNPANGYYEVTYRTTGSGNSQTFSGYPNCVPNVVYDNQKEQICTSGSGKRLISKNLESVSQEVAGPNVYPIPSNGVINIDGISRGCVINIYSMYNNLVRSAVSASETTSIDVSELNSGVYILKIQSKDDVITKRIIVN